jgi:hypothetical protein
MVTLKEQPAFVVAVEHFSGQLLEILGAFESLEEAKALQKQYDMHNRMSVTIYRTTFFSTKKTRKAKNDQATKAQNPNAQ